MDIFKKIAKYSFISSNIVSSLAMNKKNKTNNFKTIKVDKISNEIIVKNCYLAGEKLSKIGNIFLNKSNNNKYNIRTHLKKNNKFPYFHLLFRYDTGYEENYIIDIEEINKLKIDSLSAIFEKNYNDNIKEKNFNIYCLFSNNNGKDINIKRNFFNVLYKTSIIDIKNLNSFKYENIMSSFNMTAAKNIILPNNLKTNDFTDIDMNSNDFAYKFYYFAKTYKLDKDEVCEEYYKYSNGIISNEMIENFEKHLKTKESEESEKSEKSEK